MKFRLISTIREYPNRIETRYKVQSRRLFHWKDETLEIVDYDYAVKVYTEYCNSVLKSIIKETILES